MTNQQKQKILLFLSEQHLAVISTVNQQGKPQAALVGISETKELELIFGTFYTNRKYDNIKRNPNVAFVIGLTGPITIQYEGRAQEMEGENKKFYQKLHVQKHPSVEKYIQRPEERCFLVHPRWIRFVNYHDEDENFEVNF